jgi:hypothetical protein
MNQPIERIHGESATGGSRIDKIKAYMELMHQMDNKSNTAADSQTVAQSNPDSGSEHTPKETEASDKSASDTHKNEPVVPKIGPEDMAAHAAALLAQGLFKAPKTTPAPATPTAPAPGTAAASADAAGLGSDAAAHASGDAFSFTPDPQGLKSNKTETNEQPDSQGTGSELKAEGAEGRVGGIDGDAEGNSTGTDEIDPDLEPEEIEEAKPANEPPSDVSADAAAGEQGAATGMTDLNPVSRPRSGGVFFKVLERFLGQGAANALRKLLGLELDSD